MLRKPSQEWDNYIMRLNSIKQKSNREVLWTDCWMILNYEQRGKHATKFPKHKDSILTSSQFASEIQFYHIAFTHNKVVEKPNDVKLIIQPWLFDPKKGSGQIKMLEDLCRQMHVTENTDETNRKFLQNLEDSSNSDKFWDSISQELWNDRLSNKNVECIQDIQDLNSTKYVERMCSNLDEMIESISEIHYLMKTCMLPSHKYDIKRQQSFDGLDSSRSRLSANKRRKLSEWDSWFNYQSQDTTFHPSSVAESHFTNQQSLKYPNNDDKLTMIYQTHQTVQISDPQRTAFTPYQNECKKEIESISRQKSKIYKPVPLPSLNSVVGKMCAC